MEPKEFNFELPRGDTCPVSFELTDKNGNELNLEDVEVYFTMKKNYNTSEVILQKRYSRDEIEIDGKDAKLILKHLDTAELKYGKYVYDIQFMSGDYVVTLVKGTIELTSESTHLVNE